MLMEVSSICMLLLSLIPAAYYFLDKILIKKSSPNETKNFAVEKPNLPPGSNGWPLIGESLDYFSKLQQGLVYNFLSDRWKKYSSDTFRTSLIGEPMMIFSNAEGNKFLYSNVKKLVQVWWPSTLTKIFPTSDNSISQHSLTIHKIRHLILKPDRLREYVGIMDAVMKEHLQTYTNCKQVVVGDMAKRYLLTLYYKIFIGINDPGKIETLGKRLEVIVTGIHSMPINFPGTALNRAIKASKLIRKELEATIRQRRLDLAGHLSSPRKDYMSILLFEKDENGQFFCDEDINSHLAGLLLASYKPIQSMITSFVRILSDMPDVYNAVLREQKAILDGKEPNDVLSWEDLRKMKYSWNVACELLRISTPAIGVFREAITDFTHEGYTIPKGSKIYWSVHATHKNPKYFHDPEKFDPSRFQGNGPAPYTFVPFGGGPRMCPGNEYLRVALLTFVHNLLTRCRREKLIPHEKMLYFPDPRPAQGLPILFHPHNP